MIVSHKFKLHREPEARLYCCVIAAGVAASVAGSVISGAMSGGAAGSAGGQLLAGGKQAYGNMMDMLDRITNLVQPYWNAGKDAANQLGNMMANPQQALENLPGYQFAKQQGTNATINANAVKGLGSSGALLKGIGDYTTGLADQTFGAQWNRLLGLAGLGKDSALGLGNILEKGGEAANNFYTSGVSGGAAGTVGEANAYGNAAQSAGSAIQSGIMYDSIYGTKTGATPSAVTNWQNGIPISGGVATTGAGIPIAGAI